jgi:hypothetical protein
MRGERDPEPEDGRVHGGGVVKMVHLVGTELHDLRHAIEAAATPPPSRPRPDKQQRIKTLAQHQPIPGLASSRRPAHFVIERRRGQRPKGDEEDPR